MLTFFAHRSRPTGHTVVSLVEEVEKEYQWLEEERLGEGHGTEKNIADMATRMEEWEAKLDALNERLEAKLDAS